MPRGLLPQEFVSEVNNNPTFKASVTTKRDAIIHLDEAEMLEILQVSEPGKFRTQSPFACLAAWETGLERVARSIVFDFVHDCLSDMTHGRNPETRLITKPVR